jgi:hypothetical protein
MRTECEANRALADTLAAQTRAADPGATAWVSANAGSGKTHVLTQRVIRLLLAGTPPSKILCLTFTQAAAANMSLRVFDTLSKWTTLDDDALENEIRKTGAPFALTDLAFARRLFARTVETPGGLKIQTIHAFCERLLHLFPFEANVASHFRVIEDVERAELLKEARDKALALALEDETGPLGAALAKISGQTSAADFDDLLQAVLAKRDKLMRGIEAEIIPYCRAAGIGILGQASLMCQDMFGVTAAVGGGFAGLLSIFNMGGRFLWSSLSDRIGRRAVYCVFFLLGAVLYCAVPSTQKAGAQALFVAVTALIISMYGGGFATIPAYLRDLFGTKQVGAIHGRLITAWSVAAIIGPNLVNYLSTARKAAGVPAAEAYNPTMYLMAGLLLVGFLANLLVRPLSTTDSAAPASPRTASLQNS